MKKSTLMKLALTVVAMFTIASLNAQILVNYSATQLTEANSYQTTGKPFSLYVLPDPVYSPGYDNVTNAPLGATARWTWTYPVALTGAPANGAASLTNTVNFTVLPVGVYSINVKESNTISGCADAVGITQTVNVIAAPTAAITTVSPAQACGDQVSAAVAMNFTEAAPQTYAGYAFAVHQLIENIDPADIVIGAALVNADTLNFPTTAKLKNPTLVGAASPYTWSFNTRALKVKNGLRTRYTYTLVKASDAPGAAANGVISAISQKSDFGGTVTTYPFGALATYVAIVNPTPKTGPIYHISNTYAY